MQASNAGGYTGCHYCLCSWQRLEKAWDTGEVVAAFELCVGGTVMV